MNNIETKTAIYEFNPKGTKIQIKVKDESCVPIKAHDTDAGYDLKAFENYLISPGQTVIVDTGCAIALPTEREWLWEAQVRPRSGMSVKTNIRISNSPGTIDAGYRNYIGVIMQNIGNSTYRITKGDRIAQLVITKIPKTELVVVDELDETDRGLNGFGSTGVSAIPATN